MNNFRSSNRYYIVIRKAILIFCLAVLALKSFSQRTKNVGWLFLTHTQKLTKKFDLLADVQVRSDENIVHIETLLLRGAMNFHFNDKHAVALGFAHKGDWMENYEHENRIYEQYLFNGKISKIEFTARVRLEQRFLIAENMTDFSQRARAFLSLQIPLIANADFSKGMYTTIQNEFFAIVQNKEKVNNSFFDQNRTFISLGYRWSNKVDTEFGYMFWRKKEMEMTTGDNVFQIMITTQL